MQRLNPPEFVVHWQSAIPNVCAWPNITTLPDGTLMVAIFNQPCHGQWEGDLDAWVSTDQGETWTRRACIAPHEEPRSARMNCAVGLTGQGDLVALCGGWFGRSATINTPGKPFTPDLRRKPAAYRSTDAGHTWQRIGEVGDLDDTGAVQPFGDIHPASGDRLYASVYASRRPEGYQAWLIESSDGGATWQYRSQINPQGDETSILPLGEGRWLAASRQRQLDQYQSEDDGATWQHRGPLSLPAQITSHLARLPDGRILLTYGNRCVNNTGIDARVSRDDGVSWSAPVRVADTPMRDCGYPATAPLPDGRLVTAFYTQLPGEYQYEMRVTHWRGI